MPLPMWLREYGPAALLLGGAVCVSCLTVLAVALSAFGLSLLPYLPGLGLRVLLALVLVAGAAAIVLYNRRRARHAAEAEACAVNTPPHLRFTPKNAALALAGAFALIAGVGLTTQYVVGAFTSYTYTVNWFGTVPFLVLGMAWLFNGWLNEREAARASE